jgi:hypothetical protein
MKNKKKILLGILLAFIIGSFFILSAVQGANGVTLPTNTGLSSKTIAEILTKLLNWLLEIVGIIALIGFVVSGIMYLISAGNEEMVTKAKKYMTYCLVGITVVLASFVIIKTIDTILKAQINPSSSSAASAFRSGSVNTVSGNINSGNINENFLENTYTDALGNVVDTSTFGDEYSAEEPPVDILEDNFSEDIYADNLGNEDPVDGTVTDNVDYGSNLE